MTPGSYIVVLADHFEADRVAVEGRRAGWELRDTLLVLRPGPSAGFAFLFRKPVEEGTVADQMVQTGTGGINIEACRIGSTKRVPGSLSRNDLKGFGERPGRIGQSFEDSGHDPNLGRWPPNVVLVHAPGCRNVGTKKAKATSIHGTATCIRRSGVHAEAGGHQTIGREQPVKGYADAEGQEAIPAWECAPSCVVGLLDNQSGVLKSAMGRPHQQKTENTAISFNGRAISEPGRNQHGDSGGASRFFPQFQDETELFVWLTRLVSP
jgi:hypothetical protein